MVLLVQGPCRHASTVIEAASPWIYFHQVVRVFLKRLGAIVKRFPPDRLVVKLHPCLAVNLMDHGPGVLVEGAAVEVALPQAERFHPRDVVVPQLVHGRGSARAVREHNRDPAQGLVPLAHAHGAYVQEGRDGVAGADELQQVAGGIQFPHHEPVALLGEHLGLLVADDALERLLHHVVAAARVEHVVVGQRQELPVVHLLLHPLIACVDALHIAVDAVLPIDDWAHGEPADGLEKIKPVQYA
mmetsp:Transcript_23531/g.65946  ORF Transcript_23531/g.65946 Transcript_23531/m.65946 type:complete len:243 (-) Transcript_23531:828-1556(-)